MNSFLRSGLIITATVFSGLAVRRTFSTHARFVAHHFVCGSCSDVKNVVNDYVRQEATHKLALLDFDETLAKGKKPEGGGAWFGKSMKYLQDEKKLSFSEARDVILGLYTKHLTSNDAELVETEWPELIEFLHQKKIPVALLTRRSSHFGEITNFWAERLDIKLTQGYFGNEEIVSLPKDPVRHYKGALFCGTNTKQETLAHYLDKRHKHAPFKEHLAVLFADDDERNLKDVSQGLEKFAYAHGIEVTFYGVHYTALKESSASFELNAGHIKELEDVYSAYNSSDEKSIKTIVV